MRNMNISEELTYSTVFINATLADGKISMGTGFIINLWINKEKNICMPVIMTNNHVIENSTLSVFGLCKANDDGDPIDTEIVEFPFNSNLWIKHPDPNVDLCCIPLMPLIENKGEKVFFRSLTTDMIPTHEQIEQLSAIEEIIMIGYPQGLIDFYNHKPIVRRGITATCMKNDYQGKKDFLIDIACFQGSSGSPVFVFNEGSFSTPTHCLVAGDRLYLVGILYRQHNYNANGLIIQNQKPIEPYSVTSIPINLGIVIKAERLLEFENSFIKEVKNNG